MRRLYLLLTTAIILSTMPPAAADLLVTTNGDILETQGPWAVKGKLVVFTNSAGVLSSLRLSEVDLEASEEATRKAAEAVLRAKQTPASRGSAEKPVEPALVLTDDAFEEPADQGAQPQAGGTVQEMGVAPQGLEGEAGTEGSAKPVEQETQQASGQAAPAMADGMNRSMEALGEFMTVAAEIGERAQSLEQKYDLNSPEGIRAAAGDFEAIAADVRFRAESASPEVQTMLLEMARELEELAELARVDPQAALVRRRATQ